MNLKPKPFTEYLKHASVRNLEARREAIRKEMDALAKIDMKIRNELVRRADSKEVAR
jgi:thymidylate synthase ThyX